MSEEVKRLSPTTNPLRELYLKSGNQCAFPGCNELMIDNNGVFVGQVCHIEAARPGGERFNKNQTNEDRRRFENLILMCHKHHKVTDDTGEYTVERLREIKKNHESKYTDIEGKIGEKIRDYTKEAVLHKPETLNSMNEHLKWKLTQDCLVETVRQVAEFSEKIKNLPSNIRNLLGIICERVEEESQGMYKKYKVPVAEVIETCHISTNYFRESFVVLSKYSLCSIDKDWDGIDKIYLGYGAYDSWWEDVIKYCKERNIKLSEVIVNLNFKLLD